jgi:quinoprotein glucose dehydrogenase
LGAYLIVLGGSAYYFLAGLCAGYCSVQLWRSYQVGVFIYAVILAATIFWSLWEVGLEGWLLLPRIGAWLVVGVPLVLLPAYGLAPTWLNGRYFAWAPRSILACLLLFSLSLVALTMPGEDSVRPVIDVRVIRIAGASSTDWPHYGGSAAGTRFTPNDQITVRNVGRLEQAWLYRVGPSPAGLSANFEVTPLNVASSLYLCSPFNDVIALDADTGRERWRYRHPLDRARVERGLCRGVAYHRQNGATGICAERIIAVTLDAKLLALDAHTGRLCPGFGEGGRVDLLRGLGERIPGYYLVSSAPQIVRGRIVIGGRVADGQYVGEPAGVIRAFDAVTGRFSWAFDFGRPDAHAEPARGETYTLGTPNSWAPMSADDELGLVFVPTGNATPDYFSGHRTDLDNRFASSVVALDVETGAMRWSFQTVHRDIWDYDVASQPTLVEIPRDGAIIPSLILPTKRGQIFILDRRSGRPVFRVEERPVPQTRVAGERTARTQPYSVGVPSFAGPELEERAMWGMTPIDQAWCRIMFRRARYEGEFTPVELERPTISYPGYYGGMNWGSVSVDPDRQVMIVNSVRVANYNQLLDRAATEARGIEIHRPGRSGRLGGAVPQAGTPYGADIRLFLSPFGIPCQQPPYGMLSAVDLRSGGLIWTQPFGTARMSGPFGLRSGLPLKMGVPNFGGSITTRGGLTFIAAAADQYLRAYETATGRELWRTELPAGGQATPMSYLSQRSGRQFIVLAAGGHSGMQSMQGDYIIAYALPRQPPH